LAQAVKAWRGDDAGFDVRLEKAKKTSTEVEVHTCYWFHFAFLNAKKNLNRS